MNDVVQKGIVAGVAGTVTMTVAMLAAHKIFGLGALPPERVTEGLADKVDAKPQSSLGRSALTAATHLGFGASMGVVYEALASTGFAKGSPLLRGAGFGMTVWALSYFGWVPALRLMPKPENDKGRQASAMIAHLIYGTTLALTDGRKG